MRLRQSQRRRTGALRKTLNAWRRSAQIERELLPKDPAAALELAESFIQSDGSFFDRADDSGGAIGSALRAGCLLWLKAAARCEAPADQWPDRLLRLAKDDGYGAREELLLHANLLLDESAMRQLVARFEDEMRSVLAAAQARHDSHRPVEVFTMSARLTLLSQALRDPDVQVRAVRMYSPEPNPLQKAEFARAYLDCDRPEDALTWLHGSWGPHEGDRQGLLAQSLERLDRLGEVASIRKQIFERSLAVADLHQWLDDLPVFSPLSEDELHELDNFLLFEVDCDEAMTMDALDGYLHAIAIGPITVAPRQLNPLLETCHSRRLQPKAPHDH